jgi:hypothetical protein
VGLSLREATVLADTAEAPLWTIVCVGKLSRLITGDVCFSILLRY